MDLEKRMIAKVVHKPTGRRVVKDYPVAIFPGDERATKASWRRFFTSVRVYMTHRNRLGLKWKDCDFEYYEAESEDDVMDARRWEEGLDDLTLAEYKELREQRQREFEANFRLP